MSYACDLMDEIWTERPALSEKPAFYLEETYAGESALSKLARVRERMKEEQTAYHLLTSLDDIGWLLMYAEQDVEVFSAVAFLCANHHGFCGNYTQTKESLMRVC